MNTTFWSKNKVLIIGLLGAVSMVLQNYVGQKEINWPSLGLAAGIAALSFFAKEWRGQGLTITGIIGVAADTIYNVYQTGTFSWGQAGLMFLVAIITAVGADPKSRGYEQTPTILQAKAEGEAINPASMTAKPKV